MEINGALRQMSDTLSSYKAVLPEWLSPVERQPWPSPEAGHFTWVIASFRDNSDRHLNIIPILTIGKSEAWGDNVTLDRTKMF